FTMGGTLPAAARAIAPADDEGRRTVALLYGVNTLGAVVGAVLSTFVLLETFGNRKTLLVAILINALVGMAARGMSSKESPLESDDSNQVAISDSAVDPRAIYAASAIVGFAFLLMELVW